MTFVGVSQALIRANIILLLNSVIRYPKDADLYHIKINGPIQSTIYQCTYHFIYDNNYVLHLVYIYSVFLSSLEA